MCNCAPQKKLFLLVQVAEQVIVEHLEPCYGKIVVLLCSRQCYSRLWWSFGRPNAVICAQIKRTKLDLTHIIWARAAYQIFFHFKFTSSVNYFLRLAGPWSQPGIPLLSLTHGVYILGYRIIAYAHANVHCPCELISMLNSLLGFWSWSLIIVLSKPYFKSKLEMPKFG